MGYQKGWTRDIDRLRRHIQDDRAYEEREELIR
jgi:hypothetical protein